MGASQTPPAIEPVAEAVAGAFRDPAPFSIEVQGHALAFHPDGPGRLQALLALIDGARHSMRMAFYIYAADASGRQVRDALVAAARRGVAVTVVLDGFGATVGEQFFAPLVAAGGCFCCFQPRWNVRYLIRNHQKIAVADERRAMLGGFNVADAYFAPSTDPRGWTDLAFTVEGPVVGRITGWFDALARWSRNPHARFRAIRKLVREWAVGPGPVQLLIGGPTTGLSSWARHVGQDLRQAHRLDMMMAYFSPPPRLQKHIRAIARTGSARLVMPALSDNAATVGAARALYARLLDAGAQVWEFEAARMHTKLIVLDDRTYIGSANFDMRSLYLNLEIVLCIRDAALAERMRALIGDYLPACTHITPALHHARRGWWNRLRWRASWFLVSVVDYTVSRRLNLGL